MRAMLSRSLDAAELEAIERWLATNSPTICPSTATGEALPHLAPLTVSQSVALAFQRMKETRRMQARAREQA